MAAIAGRVLLLPKGVYNAATTYTLLDFVYYNNASYVCKKTSLGNLPTDDEYWQLLVDVPSAANITPESLGIGYGESTTSATSTAKLATLTDYQLKKNGIVAINFVNNVSAGSTLNINNAGTKPLFYRGAAITDGIIKGGDIATMVYDGTNYDIISIDRAVGNISDLQDVQLTNLSAGDMLVYDNVNHVWVNAQPSPGLLPHIVISSEAQATVTLTKGTTIISVPETSAGVYETDVEEYGTWTATSIKSGQTATVPVVVDTVKIYNVPLQFMSATITVTYPTGTTVTLTGQGESQTATGSPYTFTVHALGTYTVTSVLDGATKINSVTINADGQTVSLNVQFGTITVNYANEFRGATITCTHDTSTVSKTAPGNANTVDFRVPDLGSWTVSASYGGESYSDTVTVVDYATAVTAELNVVPDGSTVLPVNDVAIWLACGERNEEYTTLSQVLSDTTCVVNLMANDNAVDYLVRSTSWVSTICASGVGMFAMGASDYCANTLLADTTWSNALHESANVAAFMNISTPVMTSDTAPIGECFGTTPYDSSKHFYQAFDKNVNTYFLTTMYSSGQEKYVGYKFDFPRPISAVSIVLEAYSGNELSSTDAKIQGSNDGTTWVDIVSIPEAINESTRKTINKKFTTTTYTYFRLYTIDGTLKSSTRSSISIVELQFYGRATGGVQTWLHSANITNKSYYALSEVLADPTTLATLMSNHNAVDYLVTAKGLISASAITTGITGNALAMHNIGINNYCADTLLADSTWRLAICNTLNAFGYHNVLTGTNLSMFSNTSDMGTASTSTYSGSMPTSPYYAMNEENSKITYIDNAVGSFIKFAFSSPQKCHVAYIYGDRSKIGGTGIKIQASDDDTSWTDVTSEITLSSEVSYNFIKLNPTKSYSYYRMYVSTARSTTPSGGLPFIWFALYYREDIPATITKKTFATATDAEINEMCKWSERGVIDLENDCGWAVGQTHTTTLGAIATTGTFNGITWTVGEAQSSQSVTMVLTRKGGTDRLIRTYSTDGTYRNAPAFEWDYKNCLGTKGYMNSTNTNTGSWGASARRGWCNGGLLEQMLLVLPKLCHVFKVITAKTYNGSTNETTYDYVALRAEKEIFGARTYSNQTEADALTQTPYYETSANRQKAIGDNGTIGSDGWWERSLCGTATEICRVGANGTPNGAAASSNFGIAPFGGLG